jgi:hypothetical protein
MSDDLEKYFVALLEKKPEIIEFFESFSIPISTLAHFMVKNAVLPEKLDEPEKGLREKIESDFLSFISDTSQGRPDTETANSIRSQNASTEVRNILKEMYEKYVKGGGKTLYEIYKATTYLVDVLDGFETFPEYLEFKDIRVYLAGALLRYYKANYGRIDYEDILKNKTYDTYAHLLRTIIGSQNYINKTKNPILFTYLTQITEGTFVDAE